MTSPVKKTADAYRRTSNMYRLSVCQWNPQVGCRFDCVYCRPSFQRSLKRWAKGKCDRCYNYEPHQHPERLQAILPSTRYMQFIFTCSSGDISFARSNLWYPLLQRMRDEPTKTFLLQSKNPKVFQTWEDQLPKNLIIGTTLETNRTTFSGSEHKTAVARRYHKISQAPPPAQRFKDLLAVNHSPKMVTIEPILDFDVETMLNWIDRLQPAMVWLGYDSKGCRLPEPSLGKAHVLYWKLARRGHTVLLKTMRRAWWEHSARLTESLLSSAANP